MAKILHGSALTELRGLSEASIDSLVTDPPAGIAFMGKTWDQDHGGRERWVEAFAAVFAECLRVLKPGAHGLVWALPRTSHWTATALEDAGFEIRDVVTHHFGSGFPKSLDVSKAIDKQAGIWRGRATGTKSANGSMSGPNYERSAKWTGYTAAAAWDGWGTALKPASEHWILVRKPLRGNVAANVLEHGTGALNIDGCRIPTGESWDGGGPTKPRETGIGFASSSSHDLGRWPANLVLSHGEECAESCAPGCPVAELDEQSGELTSGANPSRRGSDKFRGAYGDFKGQRECDAARGEDSGTASRFFYVAKPATGERNVGLEGVTPQPRDTGRQRDLPGGNNPRNRGAAPRENFHPTVKPVELMRYFLPAHHAVEGNGARSIHGERDNGHRRTARGLRVHRHRSRFGLRRDRQAKNPRRLPAFQRGAGKPVSLRGERNTR